MVQKLLIDWEEQSRCMKKSVTGGKALSASRFKAYTRGCLGLMDAKASMAILQRLDEHDRRYQAAQLRNLGNFHINFNAREQVPLAERKQASPCHLPLHRNLPHTNTRLSDATKPNAQPPSADQETGLDLLLEFPPT